MFHSFRQLAWSLCGLLHETVVGGMLRLLVCASLFVAVAHRVGWLERWIWFVLEQEATKATNHARVTIGSFSIDWSELLMGQITLHASNVVVHTPQRDEWRWDSPLIARIGKATVECNAVITVFQLLVLRREVPIEAYTILVADVQVFVERRNSVINVYLLNPMLKLPPPPYPKTTGADGSDNSNAHARARALGRASGNRRIANANANANSTPTERSDDSNEKKETQSEATSTSTSTSSSSSSSTVTPNSLSHSDAHDTTKPSPNGGEDSFFDARSTARTSIHANSNNNNNARASEDAASSSTSSHNQQAKVLVNEMLHAVQVLGDAAARGQLPGAIKQQGLELVGRLQGFREQENLEEGIRVMQQMGKVAVESLQSAPQLILPQPADSTSEGSKKIIYIRIGRIVANDLRIFTKDSWIGSASSATNTNTNNNNNTNLNTNIQEDFRMDSTGAADTTNGTPSSNNSENLLPHSTSKTINNGNNNNSSTPADSNTNNSSNNQNGSWNKPIFIQRLVLRSSELCPPMSMKDINNKNLPAIYQSVDKVMEVVWRRLLAEIAKSNTGKLFSTAMGEVLSVMVSNPQSQPQQRTSFSTAVPLPSTNTYTTSVGSGYTAAVPSNAVNTNTTTA